MKNIKAHIFIEAENNGEGLWFHGHKIMGEEYDGKRCSSHAHFRTLRKARNFIYGLFDRGLATHAFLEYWYYERGVRKLKLREFRRGDVDWLY